jgi:hypothetical protein
MGAGSDDAKQGDKKIAILLRQVKIVVRRNQWR